MLATPEATKPQRGAHDGPAEHHSHDDLTLIEQVGGAWVYGAPSRHDPGRVNCVTYRPATREADCDCAAGEAHILCWHVRRVERAWLRDILAAAAARMTDAELLDAGRLAAILADYPEPIARDAFRAEWRRRAARGRQESQQQEQHPAA